MTFLDFIVFSSTIDEYLKIDFGSENEFAALKGECFEFTDRE